MENEHSFFSNDLIYNRYDLIYPDSYIEKEFFFGGEKYRVQFHFETGNCKMNLWAKCLPQEIFDKIVQEIFQGYPEIVGIETRWAGNNYQEQLQEAYNYIIRLNGDTPLLCSRINAKERYNIKRKKKRLLENQNGRLLHIVNTEEMEPYVKFFFKQKKQTHHRDYNMTSKEYLGAFYVTDALAYINDDKIIAVLFFNKTNDVIYFENFCYDLTESKWSPGYLIYVEFLLWCEAHQARTVFLSGGDYYYKKKFHSVMLKGYSGKIYRDEIYERLNMIFKVSDIRLIALYGYGKCGHEFIRNSGRLSIDVLYVIDEKQPIEIERLPRYTPTMDWPKVDMVVITLMTKVPSVEALLSQKGIKYVYWIDLLNRAVSYYLGRCEHAKI